MKPCYVCNRNFDAETVLDHGEHVIQNAIGGGLIAKSILCADCGSNLGKTVDDRFYKSLNALCVTFDIHRDRGGEISVPVVVSLKSEFSMDPPDRQFKFKRGGKPTPNGPVVLTDSAKKLAHVFGATRKQVEAFEASPTVQKLIAGGYVAKYDSDIDDFIDVANLEIRPDSVDVARGIIKIAISFALQVGIDHRSIRHFVINDCDITRDANFIKRTVLPYFPTGWCEALHEAERYASDDFPPNHQLTLFSLDERLFCHVDLFGVVQRYVLLSEEWRGPAILERYFQKCPKWTFDPDNWKGRRSKDLMVLADQFDISTVEKSPEDIQREILHRASTRPYEIPADTSLERVCTVFETIALLPKGKLLSNPTGTLLWDRVVTAEKQLSSDLQQKLDKNRIEVLLFAKTIDMKQFRIKNEKGCCPDLSAATSTSMLQRYQDFRVCQFVQRFGGVKPMMIKVSYPKPI